jgi:cation diffusion facilitator CzcD-associated flavoprotein CzcO
MSLYPVQNEFRHVQSIGILGAGLAGITAAKIFLDSKDRKFEVTIFEAEEYLGGVWSHSYPSLCIQSARDGFGWSWKEISRSMEPDPDWPGAGHIALEFKKFADDYHITDLIRFHHRVTKLERGTKKQNHSSSKRGWTAHVKNTKTQETTKFYFDFFLVANGRFAKKNMPILPGQSKYTGEILHSSDYRKWSQLAGKRVLVVGGGKSGLEISTEVAEAKQPVVLAARSVYFTPPRRILNWLNHRFLIYMPALKYKPKHNTYHMPWGEKIVYWALRPAWYIVSHFLEVVMHFQFGLKNLKPHMVPDRKFYQYHGSFDIATPGFFEALREGRIDLHRCPLVKFTGGKKVYLEDKTEVEVDIVVFCTGYSQDHQFMPEDILKLKAKSGDKLWLYRYMLHPNLKDMGFVCQADPFNSILCSELTARWLRALIEGKTPYPSQKEMWARLELDKKEAELIDPEFQSPLAIHPFEYFFYKEILQDLGHNKPPKCGDWLLEYILPCWARDYGPAFATTLPPVQQYKNYISIRYNTGPILLIFIFIGLLTLLFGGLRRYVL